MPVFGRFGFAVPVFGLFLAAKAQDAAKAAKVAKDAQAANVNVKKTETATKAQDAAAVASCFENDAAQDADKAATKAAENFLIYKVRTKVIPRPPRNRLKTGKSRIL